MQTYKLIGPNMALKSFLFDCVQAGIPVSRCNNFFRNDYQHCLMPAYAYDEEQPDNIRLQSLAADSYPAELVFDIAYVHQYKVAFALATNHAKGKRETPEQTSPSPMTGAELIAQERREQVEKHNFHAYDDKTYGELKTAAIYCLHDGYVDWPWDEDHFRTKILNKSEIGRLTVAGAFCAAEIDRLLRKEQKKINDEQDIEAPVKPPEPTTLDEAVDYILPRFKGMELTLAFKRGEDFFANMCHSQLSGGIGMKVRNELKLWVQDSVLHQYFLTEHNLFEADAMSNLIIRGVYKKLKQQIDERNQPESR